MKVMRINARCCRIVDAAVLADLRSESQMSGWNRHSGVKC